MGDTLKANELKKLYEMIFDLSELMFGVLILVLFLIVCRFFCYCFLFII